jgi:hypothetical protein
VVKTTQNETKWPLRITCPNAPFIPFGGFFIFWVARFLLHPIISLCFTQKQT